MHVFQNSTIFNISSTYIFFFNIF